MESEELWIYSLTFFTKISNEFEQWAMSRRGRAGGELFFTSALITTPARRRTVKVNSCEIFINLRLIVDSVAHMKFWISFTLGRGEPSNWLEFLVCICWIFSLSATDWTMMNVSPLFFNLINAFRGIKVAWACDGGGREFKFYRRSFIR